MACCIGKPPTSILGELKDLVNQIDCSPPPPPSNCCVVPTCSQPYAEVCMTCPPPIMAPTNPQPVKPLKLPCPPLPQAPQGPTMSQDEAEAKRYANFYNNYNVDFKRPPPVILPEKVQRPCEDYTLIEGECPPQPGCPTGFKPCKMTLTPPPGCSPCGVWTAQIQPCPPKPRRKTSVVYEPGPCTRPCCKHWKPKQGPCLYDDPCLAHCYDHPVGIKPSGRWP